MAAVVAAPLVGQHLDQPGARVRLVPIPFAHNVDAQIFFIARLPRVLAAALVGGALAASGVVFQALLRNPLATPTRWASRPEPRSARCWPSTLRRGCWRAAAVAAVPLGELPRRARRAGHRLSACPRRGGEGLSTNVLLLAGVTLNTLLSALKLFVQYLADFTQTLQTVRWLMGDLDIGELPAADLRAPSRWCSPLAAFARCRRPLNLLSLGSEAGGRAAASTWSPSERMALVSASLATGAAVSLGGPIGFIGIVVPHLVRLIVGARPSPGRAGLACFGAAFLVACDLVARTALAPLELPVGIVTALIGGPFFLWLLIRHP